MINQNEKLKKDIKTLYDRSQIKWSDHEKIQWSNYCLGVLKRSIDHIEFELMEKEFNSYDQKYIDNALDNSKI